MDEKTNKTSWKNFQSTKQLTDEEYEFADNLAEIFLKVANLKSPSSATLLVSLENIMAAIFIGTAKHGVDFGEKQVNEALSTFKHNILKDFCTHQNKNNLS